MKAETIRDFLISLGFKVDEQGAKKFDQSIMKTDKMLLGTTKTIVGLGAALYATTTAFAFQMEKMYYASKRTGASVNNLEAFEAGAARIGLSAGTATQAVEAMASAIRTNPGLAGLLNNLGVQTAGRDTVDIVLDLVEALDKMPHYQASQYARMFGMDEKTLLMLREQLPALKKAQAEYSELARKSGVDLDEAAQASKEYANGFRDITTRVDLLVKKWTVEFLPTMKAVNEAVKDGLDGMLKSDSALAKRHQRLHAGEGFSLPGYDDGLDTPDPYAEKPAAPVNTDIKTDTKGKTSLGLRNNNPGNMEKWYGDRRDVKGEGGRFIRFSSMEEGLSAMAGQLIRYQKRGQDTIQTIINGFNGRGGWSPVGDKTNKPGVTNNYIDAVAKQLGVNKNQKLDLTDPKVLAALMAAITKHENAVQPFKQEDLMRVAEQRIAKDRAQGVINNNMNTTINVAAGPTATDTANRVAEKQNQVNAETVRNMKGAVV